MPSAFDKIDAQHKPKPKELTLDPPAIGDTCAHCGAGQLECVATTNVTYALRCDNCRKEPRR